MADGKFIMFEGIDGSGTTTQSARAAEWLRRQGLSVVETFEPTDGLIGKVIRAVVVLKDGATATAAEIRKHCAKRLAGFKVPHKVDFIDALPRNPSGKVVKRWITD